MIYILVKASSLSPINIAESYWCLFSASCLQSLKNFSIVAVASFVEYKVVNSLHVLPVTWPSNRHSVMCFAKWLCVHSPHGNRVVGRRDCIKLCKRRSSLMQELPLVACNFHINFTFIFDLQAHTHSNTIQRTVIVLQDR